MDQAPHSVLTPEQRCSVLAAKAHESAYGTASFAGAWVALEQAGPWGRDAARESHLRAALGRELSESIGQVGCRFALIRSPGTHPDDHRDRPRRLLVAGCQPGNEWLLSARVRAAEDLLGLDLDALGRGDRVAVVASLPDLAVHAAPQLLVCTNGRRDVCCAVRGRPLALAAAEKRPGQVWETSHTGGHRFAPTAVLLPSGATLGRLCDADAVEALDAARSGRLPVHLSSPHHDRGRCGLPPAAQAAESAVRLKVGEQRLNALNTVTLVQGGSAASFAVEHVDGRSWRAVVTVDEGGQERPMSCGREPEPQRAYDVDVQPA